VAKAAEALHMKEILMSNVIKFERPPEPKAPKPKKTLSPGRRKALIFAGIVVAFVVTWGYFTLFGS
jgi:hypothetical protein